MSQQTTECTTIIKLALNHSNSQPDSKHLSGNHLHRSISGSNTNSLRSIPSIVTPAALDKDGLKIRLSRNSSCSEIRVTKLSLSEQEIPSTSMQKSCSDYDQHEESNIFAKKPNTTSPSSSLFPSKSTQSNGSLNPPTQKNQGFRQYSKITSNNALITSTAIPVGTPPTPSPMHKKSDGLIDLFLEIASEGVQMLKSNTSLAHGQNASLSPSCSKPTKQNSDEGKKRKYKISLDVDGEETIVKKLKMNSSDSKVASDLLKKHQNSQKKSGKKESLKKEEEKLDQRQSIVLQSQFQTPNKGDRIESVVKEGKELILHLSNNCSPLFSLQRRIEKFSLVKEVEDSSFAKLELGRLNRSIIFNSLDTFQDKIDDEDKDIEEEDTYDRGNNTTGKKTPFSREEKAENSKEITDFDKEYEQSTEKKNSNRNEVDKSKSLLEKFAELRDKFRIIKSTFKSSILLE